MVDEVEEELLLKRLLRKGIMPVDEMRAEGRSGARGVVVAWKLRGAVGRLGKKALRMRRKGVFV